MLFSPWLVREISPNSINVEKVIKPITWNYYEWCFTQTDVAKWVITKYTDRHHTRERERESMTVKALCDNYWWKRGFINQFDWWLIDSRSPRERYFGPAAAAVWRRSRGTCGCFLWWTSPGTAGSRHCPGPSTSCMGTAMTSGVVCIAIQYIQQSKTDLVCQSISTHHQCSQIYTHFIAISSLSYQLFALTSSVSPV